MNAKPHQRNKSLDRGLTILELFDRETRDLNAKQIADRLDVSPTTVYPSLHTLTAHGYLQVDERKRYRLGLKLLERAGEVSSVLDVRAVARKGMEALSRNLRANTRLAVLHQNEVLYLERVEGGPDVTLGEVVGVSVPPHCTALGKVLLAFLPEVDRADVIGSLPLREITQNTVTSIDDLFKQLSAIRRSGYGVEIEEFHLGGACVAAPIRGSQGRVVAAISTSLFASRAQGAELETIAREVVGTAQRISTKLGYAPNSHEIGGGGQVEASEESLHRS